MRKKRTLHPDLPPVSDPNYYKMWSEKNKQHTKIYHKKYRDRKIKENPDWRKYDPVKAEEYRVKNRAALMEKQWKRRGIIGITFEKYEQDLKAQEGKCKICDKEMKIPNADHDHVTGQYRGLLCNVCNQGLGIYEKHREKFDRYLKEAQHDNISNN